MNETVPRHIAIIMDGNGRWAKAHGLARVKGHEKGSACVEEVARGCIELGVQYLTLFAFSKDNWARPKDEIAVLMDLLVRFLEDKRQLFCDEKIRFRVIGDRHELSARVQKKIAEMEALTSNFGRLTLALALNYSGRFDIVQAARVLAGRVSRNELAPEAIDERAFSGALLTNDIPDPDLMIRTSGELRISNFLLWQLSYTELYFMDKYWPDFSREDLREAVRSYGARERRFGGLR